MVAVVVNLLSDNTCPICFFSDFKVNEAKICRAIRRIMSLAERMLKIKLERLLSENALKC